LNRKVSPRQRAERIDQVINLLKNYIRDLEGSKSGALGFADNPDYDSVWRGLENDDDMSNDPMDLYNRGRGVSGH
jgi:hypothetical protein